MPQNKRQLRKLLSLLTQLQQRTLPRRRHQKLRNPLQYPPFLLPNPTTTAIKPRHRLASMSLIRPTSYTRSHTICTASTPHTHAPAAIAVADCVVVPSYCCRGSYSVVMLLLCGLGGGGGGGLLLGLGVVVEVVLRLLGVVQLLPACFGGGVLWLVEVVEGQHCC